MEAADLVQNAGEGAGSVAFEGELAVRARPLEQHAGHAVPVVGPDSVSLQCNVRGRLEGQWKQILKGRGKNVQEQIKEKKSCVCILQ